MCGTKFYKIEFKIARIRHFYPAVLKHIVRFSGWAGVFPESSMICESQERGKSNSYRLKSANNETCERDG